MSIQTFYSRVVGVTFEGRQQVIEEMIEGQRVVLKPEPQNLYDHNAIAVYCCFPEKEGWRLEQIGYLPKDRAAQLVGKMPPDELICTVDEITGGFTTNVGEKAVYGVIVRFEMEV